MIFLQLNYLFTEEFFENTLIQRLPFLYSEIMTLSVILKQAEYKIEFLIA